MKKILTFTLSVAAVVASASVISAQQVDIAAKEPTGQPGQGYTLVVYSSDTATGNTADVVYIDEANMTSSSEVTFSFDFKEISGRYPYVINSNAGNWSEIGTLMFTNTEEFADAMTALEAAVKDETNPAAALKQCFEDYDNVFLLDSGFEIDAEIKKLNTSKVYTKAVAQISTILDAGEELTIEKLRSIYQTEMLLCGIEYGSNELIKTIDTNYADTLNLDTEAVNKYYGELSDTSKLQAAAIEKGAYETVQAYKIAHNNAVAIAAINASTSWLTMGTIIDELNTICTLDFPSLTETNRATVLTGLAENKPFASKEAFQTAVKTLVNNIGSSSSKPSYSTGGGSSSGGSSSVVSGGSSSQSSSSVFNDLDSVSWAKNAIEYLASKNVVSGRGDGQFAPNDSVTREEFVKILVCAFDINSDQAAEFTDVAADSWYAPYVNRAAGAEVVYGIGDGRFGVGTYITREDACVMIARAAKLSNDNTETLAKFADADSVSDYARGAVAVLAELGIVNGTPEGSFLPKNSITRAETAVIIYNCIKGGN